MNISATYPLYDDAWARRVHAALTASYGEGILEYGEWMLKPLRIIASGDVAPEVRRDTAEELRHKLGAASFERWHGTPGIPDTGRSAQEFAQMLSTLLFLHALPVTVDSAGVRFTVKDYIALQERFGDEDVLCGKLRGLGIDPDHIAQQGNSFVLPRAEGERFLAFLKGGTHLLPAAHKDVPARRHDLITANDVQMQRYHDVLPQASARLEQYVKAQYSRLYRFCPQVTEHIVMSDATPIEDGFARPDQKLAWQQEHNDRELFKVLKEFNARNHYYSGPPPDASLQQRTTGDMERLKGTFQRQLRAHMLLDRLEFQTHELVQDVPGTHKRPVVWSIDNRTLEPLMQHAKADSARLFFLSAGAGDCGETYTGSADGKNGLTSRFVIGDAAAMEYLGRMGAKASPAASIVQLSRECMEQRKASPRAAREGGEGTLLPMEGWAKKVQERKARKKPAEPSK